VQFFFKQGGGFFLVLDGMIDQIPGGTRVFAQRAFCFDPFN
jgi:hypothetical protein